MMSSVGTIAVIVLVSVTLSISLAARISLVSNNGTIALGKPLTLKCTWGEEEIAEGQKVMWRWPKTDGSYYSFYTYKYSPSTLCPLVDRTRAIKHHFSYSNTSVKCISRISLSLTITPFFRNYTDIHIFCSSGSSKFKPAWYTAKIRQMIPIVSIIASTNRIIAGSSLKLTCSWVPYDIKGQSEKYWNWPHDDGVYDTPYGYYQLPHGNSCPRNVSVKSYPDNHFAGRTRVECLMPTTWILHINNISNLDDGIPINCWGYKLDASYTVRVYSRRRPKDLQLMSKTLDILCITWKRPDDKRDIQKYVIYLTRSHYKRKYSFEIKSSLTNYCIQDLIPGTVYYIQVAARYRKGRQVPTPKIRMKTLGMTCANFPCLNGGTCVDEDDTFRCSCTLIFKGPQCITLKPMAILGFSIMLLILIIALPLTVIAIRCKQKIQKGRVI